jgi:hypothetical protein
MVCDVRIHFTKNRPNKVSFGMPDFGMNSSGGMLFLVLSTLPWKANGSEGGRLRRKHG